MATYSLMKQLEQQHPDQSARFIFGFLHGAVDDEDELARDQSDLGSPDYGVFGVGLWVGATVRGDAELAAHVANRFSISLRDRVISPRKTRWRRAFLGYLQGNETQQQLFLAAGEQAYQVECARLAVAMRAPSREDRVVRLREVLEVGVWSEVSLCARSLLFRCERDPAFLANSIEPTAAPSTAKDEE